MYIVDSTLTDEQISPIIDKYTALVTDEGGQIQAHAKWDKRRLAYEIKGRREGTYILMYFSGEPSVEKELDRVFRISDDIIRHIILRVEPERIDTSYVERAQTSAKAVEETTTEEASETSAEVETEQVSAVEEVEETKVQEAPEEEVSSDVEESAATEESEQEEPKEE